MKNTWPWLLGGIAILYACGGMEPDDGAMEHEIVSAQVEAQPSHDPEVVKVVGRRAVSERLREPGSAEFRNETVNGANTCGEVKGRNGFGGMGNWEQYAANAPAEIAFLESDVSTHEEWVEVWNEVCIR